MSSLYLLATQTTVPVSTAKSVSTASLFFQLIVALGVVLGLIAVIAKVSKGRMGSVRRGSAPVAVLGRQSLGKGVQVAIVRAGADTFVLGVTQHQVTRISRFNPEEVSNALESPDDLPAAAPAVMGVRWQSMLRQIQDRTVRRS